MQSDSEYTFQVKNNKTFFYLNGKRIAKKNIPKDKIPKITEKIEEEEKDYKKLFNELRGSLEKIHIDNQYEDEFDKLRKTTKLPSNYYKKLFDILRKSPYILFMRNLNYQIIIIKYYSIV